MIMAKELEVTGYLEHCKLAQELNGIIWYRILLAWSFLACFFATYAQSSFILNKILRLRFQGNMTFLLFAYFTTSALFSLVSTGGFGWRNAASLFSANCDLLIDREIFIWYHLSSLVMMTMQMLIPLGFSIERIVAFNNAGHYEHRRTKLGPLIFLLLTVVDGLIIYGVFHTEKFTGPFVSLILVPSSTALYFNIYYIVLLLIQIFNMVIIIVLMRLMKQKPRKRVQILETARATFCSIPTYNLIIVIIGMGKLKKMEEEKKKRVLKEISMSAVGKSGMANYNKIYRQLWEV
ncbi:hypothetical protein L5515_019702 [Caenorhabditis briggsae]|uniref:Uncharacterized protein n=1 Tax=Caenorhabditis briggsae TaxID=6238 RepID=A0AAE9FJJ4_CAEBR|nr:hypothetical protein L5515_019702 [Caenorhabditis briggsae]